MDKKIKYLRAEQISVASHYQKIVVWFLFVWKKARHEIHIVFYAHKLSEKVCAHMLYIFSQSITPTVMITQTVLHSKGWAHTHFCTHISFFLTLGRIFGSKIWGNVKWEWDSIFEFKFQGIPLPCKMSVVPNLVYTASFIMVTPILLVHWEGREYNTCLVVLHPFNITYKSSR